MYAFLPLLAFPFFPVENYQPAIMPDSKCGLEDRRGARSWRRERRSRHLTFAVVEPRHSRPDLRGERLQLEISGS